MIPSNDSIRATLLAMACLTVSACSFTSSSLFAQYDELPSASQRQSMGTWDLGDRNCKGSIQVSADKPYWVVDCFMKAGFGHCTHGLPLARAGSKKYLGQDDRIAFTILDSGELEETKDGKLVKRYAVSGEHLCGARPG